MQFPFLDTTDKSRSPSISQSLTVNLYAELAPPDAKTQIALVSRPGLPLSITAPGIVRGAWAFDGLMYYVIGKKIYTYDGTTLVNISTAYGFPDLATSTGPIQFTDNGIAPAGGSQILFSDGTNAYVLDVDPQPTITVVGDGAGAGFVPVFTNGVLTALNLPVGENSITGTGGGYFSVNISIIGGNPTTPAVATATLGGGSVKNIFVANTGSGYYQGLYGLTVTIAVPDIPVTTYGSALTIGTGSFGPITVATGLTLLATTAITVYNSPTEYMTGTVTSYTGSTGALVFNITAVVGSGSYSAWKIFKTSQIATAKIDDSNMVNNQIIGARITNAGSGYTSPPTVTVSGGSPVQPAVLVASITGSPIIGYTISNGGSGYGRPRLQQLLVGGPSYPTDSPTATATLSSGVLTGIDVGSAAYVGYPGEPSCVITGGGGIGAVASVQVDTPSNNAFATLTVVSGNVTAATLAANPISPAKGKGGAGYSTLPILTVYDCAGTGSGCVLRPVMTGVVSSVQIKFPGYYWCFGGPKVVFTGGGYTRIAKAHVVLGPADGNFNSPVTSVVIDDEGAGYTSNPSVSFVGGSVWFLGYGAAIPVESIPVSGNILINRAQVVATGTAALSSGIASITVVNQGTGYSAHSNVVISNAITSIVPIIGGSGYTSLPTITLGSAISGIVITNGGTGYSSASPPKVTINGICDIACQTLAVVSGGVVVNIIILNPGLNYTGSISVSIAPPSSGTTATATCTTSAAAATAVLQTNISFVTVTSGGAHFTDIPAITITDPSGTGAKLEAQIADGQVVDISVVSPGTNYTAPVLSFTGGAGLANGNSTLASVNCINGFGIIGYGAGSTVFQTSAINDFTYWSALDYASKSVNSDPLVSTGVGSINGYLPLFGQSTMELWGIAPGNAPPFAYSSLINTGLAAPASLVMLDNTFFWLANTNNNGKPEFLGVVRFMGSGTEVISTPDINNEIGQMSVISDAIAYAYTSGGHTFYVITFPTGNKTYAYDVSTKKWARRSYWTDNPYTYARELVQNYIAFNGKHYATDYSNGNIYTFSDTTYTDNGNPIARLRIGPPLFDKDSLNSIVFNRIEVDMATNVGGVGDIAAATCTQVNGAIQSPIIVTNPGAVSGYIIPPTVLILDAHGTGATATAVLNGTGQVASITLNAGGAGYTSPTILILGGANNPVALLSWSDDDSTTWSPDYIKQIGNSAWGARLRGVWRMTGISKKRVYRIVVYDPVSTTFIGGYIEGTVCTV